MTPPPGVPYVVAAAPRVAGAGSARWPGSWLVEGMPRLKALDAGDVARHSKQMLLFLHSSSRPIVYPCE